MWVAIFRGWPIGLPHMPYWHRLAFHLDSDIVDSLVIFWAVFFLLRGIGYYQLYRETAYAALQLEPQFANAQPRAPRMQLNPHFPSTPINGPPSLMPTALAAAQRVM